MATLASPTSQAASPAEFAPTHWTQRLSHDALDHIPGEAGWPLVGTTFKMLADPHGYARRMVDTYGPVYKTRAFGGWQDRKSVVEGKRVSVSLELGGRR